MAKYKTEAWSRAEGKNPKGGLNAKGRASYKEGTLKPPVKAGDNFNPSVMEAIAEAEGDGPPGSVADVIEPGYKLQDKVVRPARVRIIKEKS